MYAGAGAGFEYISVDHEWLEQNLDEDTNFVAQIFAGTRFDFGAADVSLPRLARMHANLSRLRLGVQLLCTDIASSALGADFDRVLVDLPCSGTGTLRKNPEIKWRLSEEELDRLGAQARELSAKAAEHVAPGGLLVLVSCSIEPEEVDRPLSEIERARDDFSPVDLAPLLPPHLRTQVVGEGLWQLLPGEQHDGFTVGVLRRRGGGR